MWTIGKVSVNNWSGCGMFIIALAGADAEARQEEDEEWKRVIQQKSKSYSHRWSTPKYSCIFWRLGWDVVTFWAAYTRSCNITALVPLGRVPLLDGVSVTSVGSSPGPFSLCRSAQQQVRFWTSVEPLCFYPVFRLYPYVHRESVGG